jgi:uncharacterized protein (DUF433 family)
MSDNGATGNNRIVVDPDVMVGKPVIRGTRVPVYIVVNFVENGHTPAEIIDAYPVLTEADVAAAVAYVKSEEERTQVHSWSPFTGG